MPSVLRRVSACSAVLVCILALSAGPAPAATTSKPYQVTFAPASIPAGATTLVSATVVNNAATQTIGSIEFTPPSGLQVSGSGRFLNLSIAPNGGSQTFTFSVTAPCSSRPPAAWTVRAKQSNDFSGTPGNDFGPQTGSVTTAVTGSCSLAWTAQPAGAEDLTPVSATAFQSGAPGPAVTVYDGAGAPLPGRTVKVVLGPSAGLGSLQVTPLLATSQADGAARFQAADGNAAVVTAPGSYSLTASMDGALSVDSQSFPVQRNVNTACLATQTCPASDTLKSTADVTVTGDPALGSPSANYATASLLSGSSLPRPACTGYSSISSAWAVVLVSDKRTKSVSYRIDRSDMNKAPNNGAGGIHVCYGEPAPPTFTRYAEFVADPANPANWWWTSGVFPGTTPKPWDSDGNGSLDGALWVLATCRASGGARPCEDRTYKNGAGDGIAEALLAAGVLDPMTRP